MFQIQSLLVGSSLKAPEHEPSYQPWRPQLLSSLIQQAMTESETSKDAENK
jgi:hypothetical protein